MKHKYAVTVPKSSAKFVVREFVSRRPAKILARVENLRAYNAVERIAVTCRTRKEAGDWALRLAACIGRAEGVLGRERHTADLVFVRCLPKPVNGGKFARVC